MTETTRTTNSAATLVLGLTEQFGDRVICKDYGHDFPDFWETRQEPDISAPVEGHRDEDRSGPSIKDDILNIPLLKDICDRKALIIVWDQMPASTSDSKDLSLLEHLTPLDWALVMSQKLLSLANPPSISIHIVNLTGLAWEDSFAIRMRHQLLADMPWVRLYAPLVSSDTHNVRFREGYRPLCGAPDGLLSYRDFPPNAPGAAVELLLDDIPTIYQYFRDERVKLALDRLGEAWRATIARSEDHHDLNNRVGGWLIDQNSTELGTKLTAVQNAFLRRAIMAASENYTNGMTTSVSWSDEFLKPPVDVLVLDDQLDKGWAIPVARSLDIKPEMLATGPGAALAQIGASRKSNLYGATDPTFLLPSLGITFTDGQLFLDEKKYDQRLYDNPVSSTNDVGAWLLVLDLRLFASNSIMEAAWYKTLAAAAQRLHDSELAWPGFSRDEKQMLSVIARKGEVTREDELDLALSLFPRLCALRWPTVPIIIYSATKRRDVIRKLAPYQNIIINDAKPDMLGSSAGSAIGQFEQDLVRCLDDAEKLLLLQREFQNLIQAANHLSESAKVILQKPSQHVVVAFDETGDFQRFDRSAIGGFFIMCGGNDPEAAILRSVEFQESLREKGVNYYERSPYYTDADVAGKNISAGYISKKTNVSEILSEEIKRFGDIQAGAFRWMLTKPNYSAVGSGFKDQAYLRGITQCIELLACELLPSLGIDWSSGSHTISLWLPSRVFPDGNEADALKAAARFDFRFQRGGYVETLGGHGVGFALLQAALVNRDMSDSVIASVRSLKVRKIPYSNDPEHFRSYQPTFVWCCKGCGDVAQGVFSELGKSSPRCRKCNSELAADYSVMAHMADELLHLTKFPNQGYQMALRSESCFDVESDKMLDDFLHTARWVGEGRWEDAFALAYQNGFFVHGLNTSGSFATGALEEAVLRELREHASRVKGATLTELAALKKNYEPLSRPLDSPANLSHFDARAKQRQVPRQKPKSEKRKSNEAPKHTRQNAPMSDSKPNGRPLWRITVTGFEDIERCESVIKEALSAAYIEESIVRGKTAGKAGVKRPRLQIATPRGKHAVENILKVLNTINEFSEKLWLLSVNEP